MTLLGALAGGILAVGLICVVTGWTTSPPDHSLRPPSRSRELAARFRISWRHLGAAIVAGLIVLLVTGWPVAGLVAVPAMMFVPRMLSGQQARGRIARLEALEQWTRRLGDVMAASRGLEEALTLSARTAPSPVRSAVTVLAASIQNQAGAHHALRRFADDVDDPVGDLVAAALLIAAERRGPGVQAVLSELAADVAKDVAARREIDAERAAYRTGLRWLIAFLLGYTAFLVVQRSYSAPFGTPAGQVVLALTAICYGAGLWWLHRLALITGPARFLGVARGERP